MVFYNSKDKFQVSFYSFFEEVKPKVINKALREIRGIQMNDKFKNVALWNIYNSFGSVHFFYEKDEQVRKHEKDGVNAELKKTVIEIVKKYDELVVFPNDVPCYFSSKQTLDEKYEGNLFFYFR